MFWRTVRVACVLGMVSMALASACGGSSSNPGSNSGGRGGGSSGHGNSGSAGKTATAGSAGAPPTMNCGTATCKAVQLPIGNFTIPACCADTDTSRCGLDSSVLSAFGPTFPDACQPLNQPGVLDAACEDSVKTPVTGSTLEIQFQGCCRDNGTCGYMLDKIGGLFALGLGCVDSAPFLAGGMPVLCGTGGKGGEGGEGGASQGGATEGGSSGASESAFAGEGGSAGG